jgi:DNA-binding CsgD family transcriptional regulator
MRYIQTTNKSAFLFSTSITHKIKEICSPLQNYLDINYFNYLKLFNDCSFITATNGHENFIEMYFESIKTQDPQFIEALKTTSLGESHFYLWPTTFLYNKLPPIKSLQNEYNIWQGSSIIYNKETYFEIFSFAFNKQSDNKAQFYCKNFQTLIKFANHFKIQAADLLDDRNKDKIALYPEKFDFAYTENNNTNQFIAELDKNFGLRSPNGNFIHLTKREFESLKLISNNKTVKEAAQLLELSPRTVEAYINNMKMKLGINYKNQLIDLFNKCYY